jgi:NAD(P)-dependent dehydrogenase (short-subunit alcohol dehydrogenase family)
VVIIDADAENAIRVADSLGNTSRAYAAALDVSDAAAVSEAITDAEIRFGALDVLINSAGIRGVANVLDVDAEQWLKVHAVNLQGTLNTIQAFCKRVIAAGRPAAVVNVSSMAGITGVPNRAAYVSSKHAVVGLTRELAIEVGSRGIRVNAVAPGMIRTPMTEVMFQDSDSVRRIQAMHALGREGLPEEVAEAILFLASDQASFISGVILPVDGAATAGKGW